MGKRNYNPQEDNKFHIFLTNLNPIESAADIKHLIKAYDAEQGPALHTSGDIMCCKHVGVYVPIGVYHSALEALNHVSESAVGNHPKPIFFLNDAREKYNNQLRTPLKGTRLD